MRRALFTLWIPAGDLLTYAFEGAAEPPPEAWPGATPSQPLPQTNVELLSVNMAGTRTAIGASGVVAVNANGRYVLFASDDGDVSPLPDNNHISDYFLRDRQTGLTSVITANVDNTATASPGQQYSASLSPDGHFVAFSSTRTDLVFPHTPSTFERRVFLRDVAANKTTYIFDGDNPQFSKDGRHILFNNLGLLYLYDLSQSVITLVNFDHPVASGERCSADGRYVVYVAPGPQLNSNGYPAQQCYLRDVVAEATTLISIDASGAGMATETSKNPYISDDAQFVVFDSWGPNLVNPPVYNRCVYRRDLRRGTTECITPNLDHSTVANVSNDGQTIVITPDEYFSSQAYLADLRTGTLEKLPLFSPLKMDGSGRLIAFESFGKSSSSDINNEADVFLYDRYLRTTRLISHNLVGTSSPSGSVFPESLIFSEDGQTVAFASNASDLVLIPKYIYGFGGTHYDAYVSSIPHSGHLLNISTRGEVQSSEGALIGGFILTGPTSKKMIIRAIGPSLKASGVVGALQDPILELHDSAGALIAVNDDWTEERAAVAETGIPPSDPLESAIVRSLDPGAYTAIVRGKDGSTGVGLVELYDLDQDAGSDLVNVSTRGVVGSGDNVLIGGFISGDSAGGSANVLVRAIGPSLTALGISSALPDPTLELHDSNGVLTGSNDGWKATQREDIEATGIAPTSDSESAVLAPLPPGAYTAIVRSKTGLGGVGLVEVYHLH